MGMAAEQCECEGTQREEKRQPPRQDWGRDWSVQTQAKELPEPPEPEEKKEPLEGV